MEQTRKPVIEPNEKELKSFFISHLNRIYCAKNELVNKLPTLASNATFSDIRYAIDETVDVVRLQIARMDEIYGMLGSRYSAENCAGLAGILDEAFQSVGNSENSPSLRDLSVLFYMQNIESIEISSFKIMLRVSKRMEEPAISQLLLECYDEAREDKALFIAITERYI